jgi:hypothetical protein
MRRITNPPLLPSADDTVFLLLDAVAVFGPDDRKTVQADFIAEIASAGEVDHELCPLQRQWAGPAA